MDFGNRPQVYFHFEIITAVDVCIFLSLYSTELNTAETEHSDIKFEDKSLRFHINSSDLPEGRSANDEQGTVDGTESVLTEHAAQIGHDQVQSELSHVTSRPSKNARPIGTLFHGIQVKYHHGDSKIKPQNEVIPSYTWTKS